MEEMEISQILINDLLMQGSQLASNGKFGNHNVLETQENNDNMKSPEMKDQEIPGDLISLNNQEHQTNVGDRDNPKPQTNTEDRDNPKFQNGTENREKLSRGYGVDAQTNTDNHGNLSIQTTTKDCNNIPREYGVDVQANTENPDNLVTQNNTENQETTVAHKQKKSEYINVRTYNGDIAYQVLDKRFGETLKKLGDHTNALKRKLILLTEENARIKRQCSKYQQDYAELKTKYDHALQRIETEKSNELNRIRSQKLHDLQELEKLSNNLKTILDGTEDEDVVLEENEIDEEVIAINDTDTQENSPVNPNPAANNKDTVKCEICNTVYSNLSGLNRHKKTQMHNINARERKKKNK